MLWSSSPWISARAIGVNETLHVDEELQIIAAFNWRSKGLRTRPRVRAVEIAAQKSAMRRAAIARHAKLLAGRIPLGPLRHVFTYYA